MCQGHNCVNCDIRSEGLPCDMLLKILAQDPSFMDLETDSSQTRRTAPVWLDSGRQLNAQEVVLEQATHASDITPSTSAWETRHSKNRSKIALLKSTRK